MSTKIKVLNAFAGFGGNTELWDRSKFEVTHIEFDSERCDYLRNKFPGDKVIESDVYEIISDIMLMGFDILWFSPPCTSHSRARMFQLSDQYINKSFEIPDFRLFELIVFLQSFASTDYVWIVENVIPYYKPYIEYVAQVGRHFIWSNKKIGSKNYPAQGISNVKDKVFDRNRMNPEIGLYIVNQALTDTQQTLEVYGL